MGEKLITSIITILVAIVGVAIIAVLVSRRANTTGVISAGSGAFSGILKTALSPLSANSSLSPMVGISSLTGGDPLGSAQSTISYPGIG